MLPNHVVTCNKAFDFSVFVHENVHVFKLNLNLKTYILHLNLAEPDVTVHTGTMLFVVAGTSVIVSRILF